MGAHTSSSKVSTQAGFIHGFSGKNKICSTPVCRLRVPVWRRRLEVGMIISETVGHFFHIKVTAGNIRRGSVQSFLWKTLDYLASTSASGCWNSRLQDWRGFLNQRPTRST